jgi:hypothetical protein
MRWLINWPRPPPVAAWPLPPHIGRFAKKTRDGAANGLGRCVVAILEQMAQNQDQVGETRV